MSDVKHKLYQLDDDCLVTTLRYDAGCGLWFEEFIDFETQPRFTPNGRRWHSATDVGCRYADPRFLDCGTCPQLRKIDKMDLIGVCFHEALRQT